MADRMPPPPPVPDVSFSETLHEGIGPRTGAVIAVLLVLLMATVAYMAAIGCDPLGCHHG